MTVIFVGDLNDYTRTYQRLLEFQKMPDCAVHGVSTLPIPWRAGIHKHSLLFRVLWKLKRPRDANGANKKIIALAESARPDIVWIEQGVTIRPETLRAVKKICPKAKLVSLGEDDMYAKHNRSAYYDRGLPLYDIVFTTKRYNLEELKTLGARRTELFLDAYNDALHTPLALSPEEREEFSADVGFCGSFEQDRAERMLFLAKNGVEVSIWGNDWGYWVGKHPNLHIKNRHLFGIDYAKAINATKINLCFLRKINRDEITSRSAEIPACGAFLLGERTERHRDFLEEGKEAEFFDSNEEMLQKVQYYLSHETERANIARAGRERCVKSGYSQIAQMKKMLGTIQDLPE